MYESSLSLQVAGDLKQREGDVNSALQLYLKGGYPAKAADLVLQNDMASGTTHTRSAHFQQPCYLRCLNPPDDPIKRACTHYLSHTHTHTHNNAQIQL